MWGGSGRELRETPHTAPWRSFCSHPGQLGVRKVTEEGWPKPRSQGSVTMGCLCPGPEQQMGRGEGVERWLGAESEARRRVPLLGVQALFLRGQRVRELVHTMGPWDLQGVENLEIGLLGAAAPAVAVVSGALPWI